MSLSWCICVVAPSACSINVAHACYMHVCACVFAAFKGICRNADPHSHTAMQKDPTTTTTTTTTMTCTTTTTTTQ